MIRASGSALLSFALALGAQGPVPKADTRSIVSSDGVHAGTSVEVALKVRLPEGVHVQADKPRDPLLIPTALAISAPAGVTVSEVVYPQTTDFVQAGQKDSLAVFEQRFVIGARLTLEPSLQEGETVVPARLRYQACNASTCFAPARVETQWVLRVVPATTATSPQFAAIFERIRFRR